MATGEFPARPSAGPPAAIDVSSYETPAVPVEPPAPAVADDAPPPTPKAPPRKLDTAELVTEGTRLAIGALVTTGRGVRSILERAVSAVEQAADRGEGDDETAPPTVAALQAPGQPENVMGALSTAAVGAVFRGQREMLAAVAEARRRYGPSVTWMLEAPGVSSVYQRYRSMIFDLYREGAAEKEAGATLAMASLQEVSDEGLNYVFHHIDLNVVTHGFDVTPLIENADLNDVIVSSTGGLATEALDNVRAQGVTVDDVITRITNRVFRRTANTGPPGPGIAPGTHDELPRWKGP